MSEGLRIPRRLTEPGKDPYAAIEWSRRDSRITNPDGSVVFEMKNTEIPASWSQVATDIMVSKYFRKAGIPQIDAAGHPILDSDGEHLTGPETSARQVFDRLAETWRWWGETHGYFATATDAQSFEDELKYMLAAQIAAPNSPQWFNTGLGQKYGLTGPAQGMWYIDPATEQAVPSPDSYSRPAPHACFPAGTRISTRDGFKLIEKIEPGDEVLTHLGRFREVRDVMQRQLDENLVWLRIAKLTASDMVATANHPVWAVRAADATKARRGDSDIRPSWIPAGDLEPGDFVMVSAPQPAGVVPSPIDLAEHAGPNFEVTAATITTRNSSHRPSLKRFIDLGDPSIMRLIGRWLGDGSIGHETRDGSLASVNFAFDAADTSAIADVATLMRSHFGADATPEYAVGQRTAHLRYTRRLLARWFENTFGKGFAGKSLPRWVFELPTAHRLELLVGLFKSDGCTLDQGGSTSLCFDQSNQNLAEGIWRIARSLGCAPALIGGTVRPGGTTPHFRVQISSKDAVDLARMCGVRIPDTATHPRELRLDDGVAYRVLEAKREPFYGTVYNFSVDEDESYVANGVVVHNCFILSVKDDLVNPGGIMDLWLREARIFKFGSGAGSNFSSLRAENERLSGGGKSSGVMSFLKIGDRAAGAIKSGGTTRRAAKMVILDLDHPDIETFIDWKKHEEDKARILIRYGGYPADFNGEAYATVSGQNSNNSVRVPNEFIDALKRDGDWDLIERTTGQVRKTVKARDLWKRIAEAAWACADPGVQYDTIINEWHTSPGGGKIRGTNPCAEFVYLDNTACNLASINLVKFLDQKTGAFDLDGYRHALRLWTIVLEISVTMAHFPSEEIAWGSYWYRPLGLGYANLGSLLMRSGIPYDSDEGRAIAGALTAILTGIAYATSAEMAAAVGPFPKFAENREAMLRVMRNHRRAAYKAKASEYEEVSHFVMGIDANHCPPELLYAARESWDLAVERGERYGYRNGQASVLAPTGTIGLLMDADTTGVEPDFSLIKFKKLAGGGYFKIVNQSVAPALERLGYSLRDVNETVEYVVGTNSFTGSPHINRESLREKGLTDEDINRVEKTLPGVFELKHAFNVFVVGEATLQGLGFEVDEYTSFEFDLLRALGFTREQIREATDHICGRQTVEGAPHLRSEHLPVFDTANKNGRYGQRFIHHTGHIKMLAATQPFLSGSASKTINLPNEATIEDIEESYMLAWELGVKCMALYRDGSKASQPLSSTSDDGTSDEESEKVTEALETQKAIHWGRIPAGISPSQAYAQGMPPPRFLLPARRAGWTQEARVGGHKVYLRTGEYADHSLGEIFIDLAKEGATLRGVLASFAIAVSKGLQYGVPLDEYVDTFTFQTFEPRGIVEGHPNIKMANSIIDYVFRAVAIEYLHRDDLAQVPPDRDDDLPGAPKGLAVEAGIQHELFDVAAEHDVEAVKRAASFADGRAVRPAAPKPAPPKPAPSKKPMALIADVSTQAMQTALSEMMGDAPLCDICGHITVRNGACYKCLNCGNSIGCS
jgi:ribonucleoside-diphosphate reductase alpha chain